MIHNEDANEQMKNPLSPVKMVRETYSKWLQRSVTEVQVQFKMRNLLGFLMKHY